MTIKQVLPFFLFLPLLAIGQSDQAIITALDNYIEGARQQWEVPGLAVAIVKNGEVLLAKGYGVRSLTSEQKVDTKTIFGIASTTKAMVAAAMGLLVDEGKIDWDDKVSIHMPEFQLYDPYVTQELKVRDLFTHNAGLGNADFLWYYNDLSADEILERMRYAKPAYSFRGGYTYQNIMYLAAGQLIAKVSGVPWDQFMQERLFKPLGMTNTYPNQATSQPQTNRSVPHHYLQEKIIPIEDCSADAIAPAGAIWSCVEDMAKWMQFMLDSARVNGVSLLEKTTYEALFQPHAIISSDQFYPTAALTKPHWTTYALGWFQHDYHGRALSFHTGSLPGTVAIIGLVPDEQLGIYVLGNLDHAEVRHAIMYKVLDAFSPTQTEDRDWSTDLLELYNGFKERAQLTKAEKELQRVKNTQRSKPLDAYIGNYYDRFYGSVYVSLSQGALHLDMSSQLSAQLEHWHYDTFNLIWSEAWMEPGLASFQLDEESGKVNAIKLGDRVYQRKN
ncbi:MAG: serine hydrolase [Saprospiraceae bacterium]